MKARPALWLVPAALGALLVGIHEMRLAGEMDTLRANVRHLETMRQVESGTPQTRAEAPPPQPVMDHPEVANLAERLAAMERDMAAMIESHNRSVEELNRIIAAERKARMRSWGPEQVTGEPDTMTGGDQTTAWAPATADDRVEWLQAGFPAAVDLAEVRVRETCNPGAITRVVALLETGGELVIWQGRESPAEAPIDRSFRAPAGIRSVGVRVEIDTRLIPGWEEIDAIALVARDGTVHWSSSASASSSYADRGGRQFGVQGSLESSFLAP